MTAQKYTDLVHMIETSVESFASRPGLGWKGADGEWRWLSYRELGERIDHVRAGLARLGVEAGETVATISANRVEWAILAYATYGLGARFCPMYERQVEEDWRYILADSEARVLVTSTREIHDRVRRWTGELEGLRHVLCMELGADEEGSLAGVEKKGAESPVPSAEIDPQSISGFIYTSGTTGKPKGVLLSHSNLISNINAVHECFPLDPGDCSVSFLPWAHSFGQTCELHTLLSMGAGIAIAESVEKLVDNFAEIRPTVLFSVPRIFNRIYDGLHKRMAAEGGWKRRLFDMALENAARRRSLEERGKRSWLVELKHLLLDRLVFSKVRARFGSRLRYAISGGAALSPEVARFICDLGITVYEGYGLTETSPIVTTNRPGAYRFGSVGRPLPGVEVRIDRSLVGEMGGEGEEGEVVVHGPNVMQGYHRLPEENARVFTGDGAFRTGDLGRLDEDGYLYITGRLKEQYKLENGMYVVPAPLEERFQLSPFVAQAFLFGENRPFNVALVVPDRSAVEKWAAERSIEGSYEELLRSEEVRRLVRRELDAVGVKAFERVQDFHLLAEEFSVDNGLLTPKLSVKRKRVQERYAEILDRLYASVEETAGVG